METEYNVRDLVVKDVFIVAGMLAKVTKETQKELLSTFRGKKADPTEFGISIIGSIFTEVGDELKIWLGSLIGKEKDEFDQLPADTVIDIVKLLAEKEDLKAFFAKVSAFISKATKD